MRAFAQIILTATTLSCVLITTMTAAAAAPPKVAYRETPGEGVDLAKLIISKPPAQQADAHGTLTFQVGNAKRSVVKVHYELRGDTNKWEDVYEVLAPDNSVRERLVVAHAPGRTNSYSYLSPSDVANQRSSPAPAGMEKIDTPFAGSGFWLSDLGLEFLHWPSQKIIGAELKKSRPCKILESINPNPSSNGYQRVVSWIDEEFNMPIMADAYDRNRKRMKGFSIKSVTDDQVSEMQIFDDANNSKTILQYEVKEKSKN